MPHVAPPAGVSIHAQQRMIERVGRDLTMAEWGRLVMDIIEQRGALLRRDPRDGSEMYAVAVGTITIRAWWNPDGGCITTVLGTAMNTAAMRDQERRETYSPPMSR